MRYLWWQIVILFSSSACLSHALAMSADKVIVVDQQLDFVSAEKALSVAPEVLPADGNEANEQQFALAALYQLYFRIDLLQPLLADLEADVQGADKARWLYYSAYCDYFSGRYSQADDKLSEAKTLLEELAGLRVAEQQIAGQDSPLYNETELLYGLNLVYLQQYAQAIERITTVYENAEKNHWPAIQARSLMALGDANYELKHYEAALGFYQQAHDSFPLASRLERSAASMASAQMTNIVGDKVEALYLLDQVVEQFKQQRHLAGLADAYLLKSYFIGDSRLAEALDWIALSVSYREQLGVATDIANAYVHYSSLLMDNGELERARFYAQKAVAIADELEDLTGRWDASNLYAMVLAKSGDYQSAYQYMHQADRTLLKKARLDITNETARLSVQFKLRQQQLENHFSQQQKSMLQEKNQLLHSQLSLQEDVQRTQHWVMLLLIALLLISLVLLFTIYRLYQRTKLLASRDGLTGLHNRRSIWTIAEREFASSVRYYYGLSVIMLDVDNFKQINDTYGHEGGDKTLKQIARICQEVLRASDAVGRIGGEEFLFVLPHTLQAEALNLAERLRQTVKEHFICSPQDITDVTVSLGVASRVNDGDESLQDIISKADKALYEAKNRGRNRVEVHNQESTLVSLLGSAAPRPV